MVTRFMSGLPVSGPVQVPPKVGLRFLKSRSVPLPMSPSGPQGHSAPPSPCIPIVTKRRHHAYSVQRPWPSFAAQARHIPYLPVFGRCMAPSLSLPPTFHFYKCPFAPISALFSSSVQAPSSLVRHVNLTIRAARQPAPSARRELRSSLSIPIRPPS